MKLELPAYEMAIVHSSMDKRIKEREDLANKSPHFKLERDEIHKLLKSVRREIERTGLKEEIIFERIYTENN